MTTPEIIKTVATKTPVFTHSFVFFTRTPYYNFYHFLYKIPIYAIVRQQIKFMKKQLNFNDYMQVGLVAFTMLGFLLTSLKYPQYGLIVNLISEFFWVYSSYKSWKQAGQIGMFINTIVITIIVMFGVINYWFM